MILANGQVLNDSEEVVGRIITPRSVSGENGKSVGVQTRLGTAINYQNEILGCQDNLGKIRNAQGETVAQVIPMSSVMDFNNKIIGNVTNMNRVSNNENKDIGYVGLDGNVHSETGGDIGIIFEYKVAFNQNNVYLGRVNRQGQVISDTGDIIGQVMYNGEVYTGNGGKGYALYDLYVYDNKGNTFGYIAKNGRVYSIMGEIKGVISQGFVLDKRKNVIARGNRDYYIRNENQKVVGYLSLDGSVENNKGIVVAQLQDNGDIQNEIGETLAKAQDLQYFHRPVVLKQTEIIQEQPKEEPIATEKEKIEVQDVPAENLSDKAQKEDKNKKIPVTHKVIGIAITPGGKYIGDVYNNDNVIDADGNIVGKVGENGQVFTSDGALIGKVEQTKKSEDTSINSDWLRQIGAGTTVSAYQHNNDAVNVGPGGGIGPGGRYNPRRAAIIANLQNQRRQQLHASGPIGGTYDASLYTGWQDNWGNNSVISTLRVDMSNVITGDKPIPAVLARSIVSLGEAPVTAIVERNIYGDAGRNVIIPAGSRIIGGFDEAGDTDSRFDNSSGGVKLDISWYRIIRPDGISFSLGGAETGDAQGRGGGALGYVDEQLLKKYTIPLLSTMSSSAIAYMMAANEDATGEVETSKQQAASDARENFLDKMDSIIDEIMESKNQIQAVTYVPAGTRIIIYPMVDLWLRTTKDIIEGRTTTANTETTSKDILIDENSQQVEGTQRVQGNQNVNNANNQQQNTSQPLIDDSGNGNQNTQNNNRNIGAIPPPAADGTISQTPIKDEDDNSGDIDLF
jgi:type IV secretion system protein VirB10